MSLSTQEQILIEQRVTNKTKSVVVAYLMWIFLGCLGGHRFYLGRAGTGIVMPALLVTGMATIGVVVGTIILLALTIWVIVDAFLIPGMIREQQEKVRRRLTIEVLAQLSLPPTLDHLR